LGFAEFARYRPGAALQPITRSPEVLRRPFAPYKVLPGSTHSPEIDRLIVLSAQCSVLSSRDD
jgi:hypothetical protein